MAADIKRAYELLQSYMDVCRKFLKGFDYSHFETEAYDLVPPAWDYILAHASKKETAQKDFCDNVLAAHSHRGGFFVGFSLLLL